MGRETSYCESCSSCGTIGESHRSLIYIAVAVMYFLLPLLLLVAQYSTLGFSLFPSGLASRASTHSELSVLRSSTSNNVDIAEGWNQQIDDANAAQSARDLKDHSAMISFSGFGGVVDMPCGMEFKDNFKVGYSRGVESSESGFWRVVKYEDGREQIEATQPVLPEWMFFFDIWESSILWRADLDYENGKLTNGAVITNKKRFGIFNYQEELATFEGELYMPGEKLPDVLVPKSSDQNYLPPNDFISPLDMERYPDIFADSYRRWWFSVEDKLAYGETPPPRPQAFFVPKKGGYDKEEEKEQDLSRVKEGKMSRRRMGGVEKKKGGKGKGF